ncbi:MAG: Phospholipase D-nuclease N-terminal [Bacteroidota bacterium]
MPILLLSILWLAAIIITVKSIFERKDMELNTRLLWTILIVVAPGLGLAIYYIFGTERRN